MLLGRSPEHAAQHPCSPSGLLTRGSPMHEFASATHISGLSGFADGSGETVQPAVFATYLRKDQMLPNFRFGARGSVVVGQVWDAIRAEHALSTLPFLLRET